MICKAYLHSFISLVEFFTHQKYPKNSNLMSIWEKLFSLESLNRTPDRWETQIFFLGSITFFFWIFHAKKVSSLYTKKEDKSRAKKKILSPKERRKRKRIFFKWFSFLISFYYFLTERTSFFARSIFILFSLRYLAPLKPLYCNT